LLDVRKNFNQFLESLDKEIEFVENLGLWKIEELAFSHLSSFLFS
jgi:hypothetical protein